MTRTQKLGLCTWLPEDPVCLAEVNDNFSRLDASGGRALRLAETGMVTLGGLMAAQAHQGGHSAYSGCIQADAFQDSAQISSYNGAYFRGKQLELLTEGLAAEGTIDGGSSTLPGSGDYNASNVARHIKDKMLWSKLFDFQPDLYGTVTNIYMKTLSGTTTSQNAQIKLGIFVQGTGVVLWESELTTIPRGSSADAGFNLALNFQLDPNQKYTMNIWIESMPNASLTFSSMKFTVTPVIHETGDVTMTPLALHAEATQAVLLLHATAAQAPQAMLRFDSGDYSALTAESTAQDQLPGGAECVLYRYSAAIPADKANMQLKFALPNANCKIFDYALVQI